MAERTRTALRASYLPDRYVTSYDSSAVVGTGATQAGPKAGRPVLESTASTDLVLEATGTQTADSKLEVRTLQGGYPEPDGAGYVWRRDTSPADTYRGWDTPIVVTGWEAAAWTSTLLGDKRYPTAVTTDDGDVVVVYTDRDTTVAGGVSYVYARIRAEATGVWGSELTVASNAGQRLRLPEHCQAPRAVGCRCSTSCTATTSHRCR